MTNSVLWLWAQHALGEGAYVKDVIRAFGSIEAFYRAGENDYRQSGLFGKTKSFSKTRLPLLVDKDLSAFRAILDECDAQGILALTPNDPRYPARLLQLPDLPLALFVRGNPAWLSTPRAYAVIGSRDPQQESLAAAKEIAGELSGSGCVIVSGGAVGIDTAAHKAALQNDCPTVLVLGCGHLYGYLKENEPLRQEIARKGVLVSEYPPHTPSSASTFPLRNRLIAGLSDAVVIIEAGEKSGTLNTANHANRQQKPLFVLPGGWNNPAYAGSRRLLQNGAIAINSGGDVMQKQQSVERAQQTLFALDNPLMSAEYENNAEPSMPVADASAPQTNGRPKPAEKPSEKEHEKFTNFDVQSVSNCAAIVYNILQKQPMALDDLQRNCDYSTAELLAALSELELFGGAQRDETAVYHCL